MSEHLVKAAKARHAQSLAKANAALIAISGAGEPVTFAAVARKAGVSTDFLYATPSLRSRIEQLRGARRKGATPPAESHTGASSAIRALSAQLKNERRKHRDEMRTLEQALTVAHGENLELRRQITQLSD